MNATRNTLLLACVAAAVCGMSDVNADFTFGVPVNLGPTVNGAGYEGSPCLSADGLTLYFDVGPSMDDCDLFVAMRRTKDDAWGTPVKLDAPLNSPQGDWAPHVSADGLELYFTSRRPGGDVNGRDDIWVAERANPEEDWAAPVNLGPNINTDNWDTTPYLSQDGLTLYFTSGRWNADHGWVATDLYMARRETKDTPWQPSVNIGPTVNDYSFDYYPTLSPDGLMLLFSSDRGVPSDNSDHTEEAWFDIWMTSRTTVASGWKPPVALGAPVNTLGCEHCPSISRDGKTLFFVSDRDGYGSWDLWQAPILPVVDFTGDGQIDERELLTLVEQWGSDAPLCNIGPMAWGDGIVDIEDLKVLAECIGKQVEDTTLLAHWALDETKGNTAHDGAFGQDGTVYGNADWQPSGGVLGGALELSGTANFVVGKYVRDPSQGPMSVLAWVKGGARGQVVVSQQGGANWLMASVEGGVLETELRCTGRPVGTPLRSQAVITDGNWHRIVLTWDGVYRTLYMDDVEVATDTQTSLGASTGNVLLGASANLAPETFWSGLIDEVRIYSRAVRP